MTQAIDNWMELQREFGEPPTEGGKGPRKWLGQDKTCDLCGRDLQRFDTFYDSRIKGHSQWGVLCLECWQYEGAGVGPGIGQEYRSGDKIKLRG